MKPTSKRQKPDASGRLRVLLSLAKKDYDLLEAQAKSNLRSMSAQLVYLLRKEAEGEGR